MSSSWIGYVEKQTADLKARVSLLEGLLREALESTAFDSGPPHHSRGLVIREGLLERIRAALTTESAGEQLALADKIGMIIHDLKCWTEEFQAIWDGRKLAEFRKDDRHDKFFVGDVLRLREWNHQDETYVGRAMLCTVTHILRSGFGMPDGYVMMSIIVMQRIEVGEAEQPLLLVTDR